MESLKDKLIYCRIEEGKDEGVFTGMYDKGDVKEAFLEFEKALKQNNDDILLEYYYKIFGEFTNNKK